MQMHNAELAYLVILASSGLCIFIDKFFADYRLLYNQLPGDYLDEVAKWANEGNAPREITQAQKAHFDKLLDAEVSIWEDAENKRKAEADEKKIHDETANGSGKVKPISKTEMTENDD